MTSGGHSTPSASRQMGGRIPLLSSKLSFYRDERMSCLGSSQGRGGLRRRGRDWGGGRTWPRSPMDKPPGHMVHPVQVCFTGSQRGGPFLQPRKQLLPRANDIIFTHWTSKRESGPHPGKLIGFTWFYLSPGTGRKGDIYVSTSH